jgi:Rrf2 family protein
LIWPAIPKRIHSAFKALCSLAEANQPVRSNEVAQQIGVSPAETAKVLQLLSWGGFVSSRRGSKGGFWLSRPPEQIRAGQIISFFDSHHELTPNADDKVAQAIRAMSAVCQRRLERLTVADLASGRLVSARKSSVGREGSK